jgi:hypothetical protein
MPLGNNEGRSTFVNISKGRIAVKENSQTVYYHHISGIMVDFEIKDDNYNNKPYKKLCITMEDGMESFELQMRIDSGYFRCFAKILPNINFLLPVQIIPQYSDKDGKQETWLYVKQQSMQGGDFDQTLKHWFTKDKPNGLPQMEKVKYRGEEVWDGSKQNQFLIDLVLRAKAKLPHPAIAGPTNQLPPAEVNKNEPVNANDITEPVDDLPF